MGFFTGTKTNTTASLKRPPPPSSAEDSGYDLVYVGAAIIGVAAIIWYVSSGPRKQKKATTNKRAVSWKYGKVVHFDEQAGVGHIRPDSGGEDLKVHHTDICHYKDKKKTYYQWRHVAPGARVRYKEGIWKGKKQAEQVQLVLDQVPAESSASLNRAKQEVKMHPGYVLGEVTSFEADRGFGWITRDDKQGNVFVHITDVVNAPRLANGLDTLKTGQKVMFKLGPGKPGKDDRPRLQARNVTLLA